MGQRRSAQRGTNPANIGEAMVPRTRSAPKGPSRKKPDLAALIEQAYTDRDLSQEAAARAAGISVSALQKILRGTTRPQFRTLKRIAAGLRIPLNPLLEAAGFAPVDGGDEPPDREPESNDEMEKRMTRVEQAVRQLDGRQNRTDTKLDEMASKMTNEFADVKRLITELVPSRVATAETPQSPAASPRSGSIDSPPERPGPRARSRRGRDAR